ncbi:LysR family transcriptional regulator [Pseudidiomarina insulisalsae]|uniref:LysR family transcriptional regulator n=1 Tax=Pseudidiomarina insulisalsae TaxID=575789 RepID=A0A432YQC2_9GAMM|nr:LysR family transcriptional regulator [Pseudidiomarina insulisalsae]RUO63514.1 LysR family transcriptional regulator [Pseudidiomarina insulisalsae]
MRLRHIEVFHAIYHSGSLTRAAQVLHISQPAVSKTLAHAEQQLGFKLFKRSKGKLLPTEEAHALFPQVEQLYRQLQGVKSLATNLQRDAEGLIDLAISPALGFDSIPLAIAQFQQAHPKVRFRLQTIHNDEALTTLIERKAELAILFDPPSYPGTETVEIAQVPIKALYPKRLFADPPARLSLSQLAEQQLIDISDSGPVGQLVWRQLQEQQLQPHSQQQVDTYFIAARFVAYGLGCCAIDALSARGNRNADVAVADLQPALSCPLQGLHLSNKSLTKLTQAFLPYLAKAITQLSNEL